MEEEIKCLLGLAQLAMRADDGGTSRFTMQMMSPEFCVFIFLTDPPWGRMSCRGKSLGFKGKHLASNPRAAI